MSLCKRGHHMVDKNVVHKSDGSVQCRACKVVADAAHGIRRRQREKTLMRDSRMVLREAHNLERSSSILAPATNL